ncbi:MAG: Asp23/Gls24 family envelope stress response protein [Pseudopedobacter sp.]|nr:Asp23/Gls24 family envelope stress response protein [Deinococcales bacterium]
MPEVDISNDVILGIASLTLERIPGLEPISPPLAMPEVLTGKRAKGFKIERSGRDVTVNVTVSTEYGVNIRKVCEDAQKSIFENIEVMTGLSVKAVNITVQAVMIPKGS